MSFVIELCKYLDELCEKRPNIKPGTSVLLKNKFINKFFGKPNLFAKSISSTNEVKQVEKLLKRVFGKEWGNNRNDKDLREFGSIIYLAIEHNPVIMIPQISFLICDKDPIKEGIDSSTITYAKNLFNHKFPEIIKKIHETDLTLENYNREEKKFLENAQKVAGEIKQKLNMKNSLNSITSHSSRRKCKVGRFRIKNRHCRKYRRFQRR